eukprot:360207-Chlamydomonas_euryale.AAC.6
MGDLVVCGFLSAKELRAPRLRTQAPPPHRGCVELQGEGFAFADGSVDLRGLLGRAAGTQCSAQRVGTVTQARRCRV